MKLAALNFLFFGFNYGIVYAQNIIEYKCSETDNTPVNLNVTASSEPMDYQVKSFYIYKYDLMIGDIKFKSKIN